MYCVFNFFVGTANQEPKMKVAWHKIYKIYEISHEGQEAKKRDRFVGLSSGWEVGLEPTTSRSTIWRSNQLNYAHHVPFLSRKAGAKVQTFLKLAKKNSIFVSNL